MGNVRKKIFWSAALVLVGGIIAIAVYWGLRPQVITLKDGTKLTLVGAMYGRRHFLKGFKTGHRLGNGRSTLDTTNDTLVVWVETPHKGEECELFVYDPSNTACVSTWPSLIGHIKAGTVIEPFILNVFPRRDGKMILRVGTWDNDGFRLGTGQFIISNPGPRSFPDWTPDPLPDTQSDGDLDVTLTKCVAGGGNFTYGGEGPLPNDLTHKGVLVAFHTVQNGNAVTNWQPVAIETSDATGNQTRLYRWDISRDTNNDVTMKYQWGLWPSEPAWKLRVEMSRTSGWTAAETWSVNNVPVRRGTFNDLMNDLQRRRDIQANSAFAQGMINGHSVSIFPIIQITDQGLRPPGGHPGDFYVMLEPDLPAGYQLSAIITDEHGHKFQDLNLNGRDGYYSFWSPDIGDAQSFNVTLALHKNRFVEFTIKPTTQ